MLKLTLDILQRVCHHTVLDLELMAYIASTTRCADRTLNFTQKRKQKLGSFNEQLIS